MGARLYGITFRGAAHPHITEYKEILVVIITGEFLPIPCRTAEQGRSNGMVGMYNLNGIKFHTWWQWQVR